MSILRTRGGRAVLLTASILVASLVPSASAAPAVGAHVTDTVADCRFTAWENEPAGPLAAGAVLDVGGDIRCVHTGPLTVRIYVTSGLDDASLAGGSDLLAMGGGPRAGTLVTSFWAYESGTSLTKTGQLPVPGPGQVYTVHVVAEVTSGCGRSGCPSYAPAPPAPAAPGRDLSRTGAMGLCAGTVDTFDFGCQYQFTVVGA